MSVLISPNIHHEKVMMDNNGNLYDPQTKQKVKMVDPPYQPTPEEVAALANKKPTDTEIIDPPPREPSSLVGGRTLADIQAAIKRLEHSLEQLKVEKKQKVEQLKKELEQAEADDMPLGETE